MSESILFATDQYMENLNGSIPREFDYRKIDTSGDWGQWQQSFRERLTELTGLSAIREQNKGVPLNPRAVDVQDFATYRREKMYITSEPEIEIPFYLLLPKEGTGPYPLVLTPHGHNRRGKEVYSGNYEDEKERKEALAGDRDVALQAVAEGYAVIAMDVRGFWEMSRQEEYSKNAVCSCDELQKRAYMYGRTLIGERVYDMGRLIDYAATRTEIDTSKIVITGNSGGGTVTLFTAALDERISIAIPSSYFCTFAGSILSVRHCLCNYIPGMMKLGEMYDVAGLIAPRPVLFVNGIEDKIFPIEHTREAFAHTRNIYKGFGEEYTNHCELYEGQGGHRYYKDRVWSFVREHLGH